MAGYLIITLFVAENVINTASKTAQH